MKKWWIIVLGCFVLFIVIGIRRQSGFMSVKNKIREKIFNGTVKAIKIGERDVPYFVLVGDSISMGAYGHNLKRHLKVGDSIVKFKESSIVFIYRFNDGDTIMVDLLE
ncbi:MAG: hypothetical protein HC819_04140 [Cyclobacteriaceae bacterium]|nr:hypothetical protein [Cyclobacteriaceae bacterium]